MFELVFGWQTVGERGWSVGEMLLASSGWEPRMLLSVARRPEEAPTKNYPAPHATGPSYRGPGICFSCLHLSTKHRDIIFVYCLISTGM